MLSEVESFTTDLCGAPLVRALAICTDPEIVIEFLLSLLSDMIFSVSVCLNADILNMATSSQHLI